MDTRVVLTVRELVLEGSCLPHKKCNLFMEVVGGERVQSRTKVVQVMRSMQGSSVCKGVEGQEVLLTYGGLRDSIGVRTMYERTLIKPGAVSPGGNVRMYTLWKLIESCAYQRKECYEELLDTADALSGELKEWSLKNVFFEMDEGRLRCDWRFECGPLLRARIADEAREYALRKPRKLFEEALARGDVDGLKKMDLWKLDALDYYLRNYKERGLPYGRELFSLLCHCCPHPCDALSKLLCVRQGALARELCDATGMLLSYGRPKIADHVLSMVQAVHQWEPRGQNEYHDQQRAAYTLVVLAVRNNVQDIPLELVNSAVWTWAIIWKRTHIVPKDVALMIAWKLRSTSTFCDWAVLIDCDESMEEDCVHGMLPHTQSKPVAKTHYKSKSTKPKSRAMRGIGGLG